MKSLITLIAIFFSLNLLAFVNPVEQEFSLDDPEALEFNFPHVVQIESVEVIATLFSKPLVRIIGTANDQAFDLTKKITRDGPVNEGMFLVKTVLWKESIGGETCEEAIDKEVVINFKVSKKSLRTSSYEVSALRYVTPDLCHSPFNVREFSYSLNK
ncbi:MAG: hypothetical protein ACJAT2_001115 [Bacteriovoracaceae bacterium]|jgi:hypothetical protein